ncbi:hypothetical protein TVAG_092590 [Trichomonas vaginalis G3]|uniref:Uncharacterized protein n=1 Tax=Trichomonas vaginalis (strain ATCC PRA-98 / G3) TaxID=412133 RepID=A2F7D5_TRIV3|nr:keratinocyte-associated protein 2 family [Trichomonas vaginalis G3]EAX99203.1 hypothetical protein TVAG_092590 [Trichomonas vaginalis G3]KAI5487958.1 keratinocyte-associated protein 2 family [Trichomonas vaginalis G3]|eukprot:XP_001312133.1 hypothetical protein [Trichomonas vaginalis G3]
MAKTQTKAIRHSKVLAIECAVALAVVLFVLCRFVLPHKAEIYFFAGLLCAVIFFFLVIAVGNYIEERDPSKHAGWGTILVCEAIAAIFSYTIHPICITTCILFSFPAIVYIKYARFELTKPKSQK